MTDPVSVEWEESMDRQLNEWICTGIHIKLSDGWLSFQVSLPECTILLENVEGAEKLGTKNSRK